ncbi:MAG: hypothetical protein AUJ23_00710 [Candidatus Magasanikbacteria bacterium CG1_02_32_51]|uniref:Uncharacterized protein n=1 Tax=Candidatus Magasanikbacteria bacterium CG1_02_32_51 TaxID=1805238 RepID=A0A1J4UBR9_9BACT|nr:MAG: hypothetical protein AUJ23_00710 [Candidatus Magasanikbacteria bacterium CG1_02_32_51]
MKFLNKEKIFVVFTVVFLFIFSNFSVVFSVTPGSLDDACLNNSDCSSGLVCTNNLCANTQTGNTKFCICTQDKSSCETSQYADLPTCNKALTNSLDKCVPLVSTDSSESCDSLVSATQSIGGDNDTGGSGNTSGNGGNSNSDLLNNLRPQIEGLNKLPVKDLPGLIGQIINTLLGILGSIALAMIIYGGVLFMIANGNPEKKKKATGLLVWSVLGIAIIFASYGVINFVFDIFR